VKGHLVSRLPAFGVMVLLSFLAWIYVTASEARVETFPGKIPLSFRNVPTGLVPIVEVEEIEVRIRADAATWSTLSADAFSAHFDVAGLGVGTHEVSVTVSAMLPAVQIIEKRPSTVLVRLEEEITKDLPVRVVVQGKAADGKAPGEPKTTPERATVAGPKSVIEQLTDVQAVVTLGGETTDVQRTVRLQVQGRSGEPLPNLRFDPLTVSVSIPIVQAADVRTVGVEVKTASIPPEGLYVQRISVTPATIAVTGAEVTSIPTIPVDLSGLTQTRTMTIDLAFPSGTLPIDRVSRVTVTFTIAPIPTSKQVPLTYTFVDIDPALKVESFDPPVGKAVVVGPATTLATTNAVTATISLAGRGQGTHAVDVGVETIQAPAGASVSGSPTPSAVTVVLVPK
jgi:YbbR domain-containing protein